MKKKVLSALLAVCMFAGMAIPALASTVSSQAGDSSKVDKLQFTESSYTIKENDKKVFIDDDDYTKNLVKAFEGKDKYVPDAEIDFELSSPDGSFALSGNTVYALEKTGTATLKAIAENDKVVATVKLVAAPGLSNTDAKGFRFEMCIRDRMKPGTR